MNSAENFTVFAKRIAKRVLNAARRRLTPDPDRFLKRCRAIVHVGANEGQEREIYNRYKLMVFWIEPIPDVYQRLVKNISAYGKQVAIQALVTDRPDQTVKFNISTFNGVSSSIFDLALHKDIWPENVYIDALEMQTETLDRLLERGLIRLPIDAIILDIQGAELLALKGGEALLRQTQYVKAEAADFEAYKGCAKVDEIAQFLKERSFDLIGATKCGQHPSAGAYYDLVFKRATGAQQAARVPNRHET